MSALDQYLKKASSDFQGKTPIYDFSQVDSYEKTEEKSQLPFFKGNTAMLDQQTSNSDIESRRRDRPSSTQKKVKKNKGDRKTSTSKHLPDSQMKNQARLQDLCPEDKSKIGDLVKKLAMETKKRQDSEQRFNSEKSTIEDRLKEMERQTKFYEQERDDMCGKVQKSVTLLNTMKEEQKEIEQLRLDQSTELMEVRQELLKVKEQEQELQKSFREERKRFEGELSAIKTERSDREESLSKQLQEKETLLKNSQDLLLSSRSHQQQSQYDENGMKEIGELKSEISRLTESFSKFISSEQKQSQYHQVQQPEPKEPELMSLDELQSMQDNLVRKLTQTNTLIQAKSRQGSLQNSPRSATKGSSLGQPISVSALKGPSTFQSSSISQSKSQVSGGGSIQSNFKLQNKIGDLKTPVPTQDTNIKPFQANLTKEERIRDQAQRELKQFQDSDNESDEPMPNQMAEIPVREEKPDLSLLNQKLEYCQQIQQRFGLNPIGNQQAPFQKQDYLEDKTLEDPCVIVKNNTLSSAYQNGRTNQEQDQAVGVMQREVMAETPGFHKEVTQQRKQSRAAEANASSAVLGMGGNRVGEVQPRDQTQNRHNPIDSDEELIYSLNEHQFCQKHNQQENRSPNVTNQNQTFTAHPTVANQNNQNKDRFGFDDNFYDVLEYIEQSESKNSSEIPTRDERNRDLYIAQNNTSNFNYQNSNMLQQQQQMPPQGWMTLQQQQEYQQPGQNVNPNSSSFLHAQTAFASTTMPQQQPSYKQNPYYLKARQEMMQRNSQSQNINCANQNNNSNANANANAIGNGNSKTVGHNLVSELNKLNFKY